MLTLFSKQITKAIDECKSSAVMAKKFVGNIETKKWSLKKKNKVRAYQVTTDDDDEYVSWGSDFDESCSEDGTEGVRTGVNCDNVDNDDYDINDDDEDEDDRLTGRCGSYTLNHGQTDCQSSHHHQLQARTNGNTVRGENINHESAIYDNTYEAISETPSTSSYGGSSENSSTCYYETPPERRRGSCPSDTDKSSSGIGGMNGSTRSNSGDDRSDLSSLHFDGYSLDEKKRNSHDHDSDHYRDSHNHLNEGLHHLHHHHPHQLSVEVTTEYIMRELHRKKRTLLNGFEASSETSSGQCSEPSPKPRIRPLVKPAIPPKPNIAQFGQSKPSSPGNRRKLRRKIVRPTGEPPPPPVPKSPPPISPASSKLSLTDRLAELTLDDLNEVLGVQLSSEPEDNGIGDDGDGTVSKSESVKTLTNIKNDNMNLPTNCLNDNDEKQLQSINNHNLTGSQTQNQEQSSEMGLINTKIIESNQKSETNDNNKSVSVNNNYDSQSSSIGINEINDIVNSIMDHDDDDEDFGDYETPLNFKDTVAQSADLVNNLRSNSTSSIVNKPPINITGSSSHHQCNGLSIVSSSSGSSPSPLGCIQKISRSSSVASGSYPPDLSFSDCAGISPYPISPPPPFDDNYCCSCRKLMKSVGSTPNLNAIRSSSSSSRSELSFSPVNSTIPSSSLSTRNQSNQPSSSLSKTTAFDNNSHNSSSANHHHHHHHLHHHIHHNQQNQHSHLHSHSTSNLSLLTVDRPKLPRAKPDCGNTNSNNSNSSNNKSCSYNNNNNLTSNNNNNNNTSTGISLKAEIAAKFAEKAAYAKKIINSRPPFKPFESIYATGKSFGFSSSSSHHHNTKSSMSASSLNINSNNNHNINRSGSISNLAQRPLPPLPDDVMPIEKYSWFHGLERDSASIILENLGTDGSYLVRPSKRAGQSNPLTLSILHHGKVFHLNIRRRSDGLYCLGKEKDKERTFASVPALIRFHQKEPILLTTKGESAGITKLMVTPISSSSINPSSSSQLKITS